MNYKKLTKSDLIELLVKQNQPKILCPQDVQDVLVNYVTKAQEYFLVITLDGSHKVQNLHEVTKGLANRTLVHPREVFRPALLDNAVAVIVAHNHPSGNPTPSPEDIDVTKRLLESGKILGIQVLDHIIIGTTFCSVREQATSLDW